MKKFMFSFVLLCLSISTQIIAQDIPPIFGGGWSKISFKTEVNPKIDINTFNKVIIPEIHNKGKLALHERDIYDEFSDRISDIEGLTLVDRQESEQIFKEIKYQQNGDVDDSQIIELGQRSGSKAIIIFRIQVDDFSQQAVEKSVLFTSKTNCKTVKYQVGKYDLDVNVKIIDLKTLDVLVSETLKANIVLNGPNHECKTPPKLNETEFYELARQEIGRKFDMLFVKSQVEYTVDFQTNNKFNDQLKGAINLFKIDDFDGGYNILENIAKSMTNEKAKSSALYNLALIQKFKGNYNDGLENVRQAYLLNPKNNDCLTLMDEIKNEQGL